MNFQEIIKVLQRLAKAQGKYAVALESIAELKVSFPEVYDHLVETLERQNFKDEVDLIMFLED